MYAPTSKEQASELVSCAARFINECVADQIRLAPEKCTYQSIRNLFYFYSSSYYYWFSPV